VNKLLQRKIVAQKEVSQEQPEKPQGVKGQN